MFSGGHQELHEASGQTYAAAIRADHSLRQRVLTIYALLAVISLGLFGLLHIMQDNRILGQLELLGALAVLIIVGGLRITHNLDLARSCFLLTIIAMLVVMLITGGTEGTGVLWCFLLPVAAFFLAGKQEGTSWMALFLAVIFLLWAISEVYNIPLYYNDVGIRQLMITLLIVSIALYVYQASREAWESQARNSQQQLQANLRQMSALHAKVDYAKSEFVTLASHQLRTPISAIGWNSEMLLSGDMGKLTKDQQEYVQGVYDSNRRLAAIVDSMLLVSSLEIGSLYVRPELMELTPLLRKILHDETRQNLKKIEVIEKFAPDIPKIEIDSHIIKQIFQHLFSNAFKYTPDDGRVEISVQRSDKRFTPSSKGSVEITVSDTGYGIPKDEQKNVFAKLFRAANIKTKDVDGTGLGLYIVKALVDKVGGSVSFESKENKGSIFTVRLPLEGMASKEGGKKDGDGVQ